MALIVQKYGGTSVGTIERIKNVAAKVKAYVDQGHHMVVVLSAMAGVTNSLIELAHQISPEPDPRELDVLMATGEQQSVALFGMAARDLGMTARSLLGFQAAILTDRMFGRARINHIATERVRDLLTRGRAGRWWWPASRAWTRTPATSPPWAGAAATPRPWPWPPR